MTPTANDNLATTAAERDDSSDRSSTLTSALGYLERGWSVIPLRPRGKGGAKDVNYRTTPRFLEVFGLKDLAELPQSDDDLSFK